MTAPSYIALRTDLRFGTLYDMLSGFTLSGNQVKPYPTDPAQRKAVDTRLNYGILVPATEQEYLSQNPVVVPPPEQVILTEPVRIVPDVTPTEGTPHVALILHLDPVTTSAFVVDPIVLDEGVEQATIVLLVNNATAKQFCHVVIPSISGPDLSSTNVVVSDGVNTYFQAPEMVLIGDYPVVEEWAAGFMIRAINVDSTSPRWHVGLGDRDITADAMPLINQAIQTAVDNLEIPEPGEVDLPPLPVQPSVAVSDDPAGGTNPTITVLNDASYRKLTSTTNETTTLTFTNPGSGRYALFDLELDLGSSTVQALPGYVTVDEGTVEATGLYRVLVVGQGEAGTGDPASVNIGAI